MKTNRWLLKSTLALFVVASGAALVVACSSSSNPEPASSNSPDGSSGSSSSGGGPASSSGSGTGSSSGGGSSGASGDAAVIDAAVTDAAPCANDGGDAASCHSCATLATDQYNTCSPFVTNCVHFDNSVVPQHSSL